MKKILLIFAVASAMMLGSCNKNDIDLPQEEDQTLAGLKDGDIIPGQYVVLLKEGVTSVKSAKLSYPGSQDLMRTEVKKILSASKIAEREPLQVYSAGVEGFAVKLSEEEAAALESNPGVRGVWPDKMVVLAKPAKPTPLPTGQTTPYGITRVGGGATYTGDNKIWIIDTGIDLDHPDLNVDKVSGYNFISNTQVADDDNGHGTHCAGIAAAVDNEEGVIGVAAGAPVVPVKVLNRRGSGAYSTIIAGINFVIATVTETETETPVLGDAVNMSLGGGIYDPIDLAVIAMGEAGFYVSLAAGNESDEAINHSPARANGTNIYTISACDKYDVFASWSNYGTPPVDYCAPGVSIYSTYKGGGYATMSGTSMAAPHACGVLLVTGGDPKTSGYVKSGDPDGNADPIIHN